MNLSQIARLIAVAGLAVAVVLAVACGSRSGEATRYHCPMHPTYISDQPGDCPICGMRLVPIEKTGDSAQGTGDSSPPPAGQGGGPRAHRGVRLHDVPGGSRACARTLPGVRHEARAGCDHRAPPRRPRPRR